MDVVIGKLVGYVCYFGVIVLVNMWVIGICGVVVVIVVKVGDN